MKLSGEVNQCSLSLIRMVALLHRLLVEAWLQDPRCKETMRFRRANDFAEQKGCVVVECGQVRRGHPVVLRTRTMMTKLQARDWWRKLIREGWQRVDPQW